MRKVAIVGGGVAGMGAAQRLVQAGYHVTLFEYLPRLGGDCFGVDVQLAGRGTCRIDAGVSDFNEATFVRVKGLLDELGLPYRPIVQDASFMTPDGEALYCFRGGELKVDWPAHVAGRFAGEIARWRRECVEVLDEPGFADWTLGRYLEERHYSNELAAFYVYPRAIGCFPMPNVDPASYLVRSLVSFWHMHGVVGRGGQAQRMCIPGGMHQYCSVFEKWFSIRGGQVRCSTRVVGVVRRSKFIEIRAVTRDDEHLAFKVDHVIFATNPNEVVPLLEDPTVEETAIFDEFPYQRARLVVHMDPRLMPRDRRSWGAYNYLVPSGDAPEVRPTITFWPNLLASLPEGVPDVFVSMNPHIEPDERALISNRFFEHPVATGKTHLVTERLSQIQGRRHTWFCGSYLREPFCHEQALGTGQDVALRLIESDTAAD